VECGVDGSVGVIALGETCSIVVGRGVVVEERGTVVVEEGFARGGRVGAGERRAVEGQLEGIFVVEGGETEFDCLIELLGGCKVDAKFEAGFGILVVAG